MRGGLLLFEGEPEFLGDLGVQGISKVWFKLRALLAETELVESSKGASDTVSSFGDFFGEGNEERFLLELELEELALNSSEGFFSMLLSLMEVMEFVLGGMGGGDSLSGTGSLDS